MTHPSKDVPILEAKVVIPVKGAFLHTLAEGSGIVMYSAPKIQMNMIDYEGNLYNAVNLRMFHERVESAYGRAKTRYPTSARSGVLDPSEFVCIGYIVNGKVEPLVDPTQVEEDALKNWTKMDWNEFCKQVKVAAFEEDVRKLSTSARHPLSPTEHQALMDQFALLKKTYQIGEEAPAEGDTQSGVSKRAKAGPGPR